MRPGAWIACLGLACAACGEPPGAQTTAPTAAPAVLPVAPANGRMVVAEVDGAPVYDDCVAAQATAHGLDRRAALDECIAIELLAREAERRGLAVHPDVRRTQKTEAVRRLIDLEFVARYPDPGSMPRSQLEVAYNELRVRYVRPEFRETTYVRVPVPVKEQPPGSPADAEAQALMARVHATLAGRRDLTSDDVMQAMAAVMGERKWEHSDLHPIHRRDRIVEPYLAATFAIAEPGMVSPPFRTEWGWDIVLLQKIHPAANKSVDEAAGELFEIVRRRLYQQWVDGLVASAGAAIDQDALARFQAADERARFVDVPAPNAGPGEAADGSGTPGAGPGGPAGGPE